MVPGLLHIPRCALAMTAAWLACLAPAVAVADEMLEIYPTSVSLHGADARQQLVVTLRGEDGPRDVTREVSFESRMPEVAIPDAEGSVWPVADGAAEIVARLADLEARVEVVVAESASSAPPSFENGVLPILTANGCNSGACHGKQRGQNGFQLSLLAFDPEFDFAALVKEGRGRRVFPGAPDQSLLLRKGAGLVPHGGGRRLDPEGEDFALLHRWIAAGMPRRVDSEPVLERVTVYPTERVMTTSAAQQLVVTAHYSDGTTRDVTRRSSYQSNESAIADADAAGLASTGPLPGEAAIMARYMGHLATTEIVIPHRRDVPADAYAALPRHNFVDELVWRKLQRLGILPSDPAGDATFIRRASIDIIGRVPSADEVRAFLADPSSDKRERLVDELLARPEYADHWANKWVDLLRPNPYRVGIKAVLNYDNWIRDSFRKNKPYDEFVRGLVAAQGSTWRNGAVTMFRDRRTPDEIATLVSQLFLGVRIECAKCHQHPFEAIGQDDFYSFAAYFARIGYKGKGLSPPISGGEEMIYTADKGDVRHPLTGEVLSPRPLFGSARPAEEFADRREALAEWITSDDNPYFVQVIANRVWADLMGRGLVDPVDDLRATNPPTNAALLEALGEDFRAYGYDLKHLIRTITTSYVYGLSTAPSEHNVADTQNHSRYYRQRLRAEALLDAVADVTGVPESLAAMPPRSRASEIWTHRIGSLFLDTFGRPDPNQDPPCERTPETTVVQALHLMNSPHLHGKITSDNGRTAQLAASERTPDEIIEELYLSIYSRLPDGEERQLARALFEEEGTDRRKATEDLMWALLNTPEFVFKN